MLLVPRTCLRQSDGEEDDVEQSTPTPLDDTQAMMAYVLLGDPGLGKSAAFKQQADAVGGHLVSASDFLALDHPDLRGSAFPVFIDGLDETRAGVSDGRVPLDNIRKKLQQLGCSTFRLSCRAADWLGNTDAAKLRSLLPESETLEVFTLQPLTLADIAAILPANHGITASQAFITSAELHGLTDLLFNPQTLSMLATAVGPNNRWPETRLAVYAMACDRLVQEHNEEHLAATRKTAAEEGSLRRAAAYLCAIQLIADLVGFTHSPNPPDRVVRLNSIPNPERLPLDEALSSRLFRSVGRDVFAPVHRTVAEFLTARCLADRLLEKLTVRRARALICGPDGGVVSSMRGLASWLASMSAAARVSFTRLDSLGVLLYGDAKNFSIADKSALMEQLGGEIAVSSSFRWHDWKGRPFSALVTKEMRPVVTQRLADTSRTETHQLLVRSLLEGLVQTSPDDELTPLLLSLVRDASRWPAARGRALKIYLRWVGEDHSSLRTLLDDVRSGAVTDSDDEILGALLMAMYPRVLTSAEVVALLHAPKQENLVGNYFMFWRRDLHEIDIALGPELLDGFATRSELRSGEPVRHYAEIFGNLLARVLTEGCDEPPDERLLNWLDAACDEYGGSLLEDDDKKVVQQWLQARPLRYFSLLDVALRRYAGKQNRGWSAQARLHGAKAPDNEATWWLAKAKATTDAEWGQECFVLALHAIQNEPGPLLEGTLTACENLGAARGWQALLAGRLTCTFEQWKWKLDEAAGRQKRARDAAGRRDRYRARLDDFLLPLAPLDVLDSVASVYAHRHYDINGETPQERLTDFFAGDRELVQAALAALRNTIERKDLPSINETLEAMTKDERMVLNTPALIGLELAHRQDSEFLYSMSDARLVAALVAHLVLSVKDHDTWVAAAVASRPQCMVNALSAYFAAAVQQTTRSLKGTHLFHAPAYAEVTSRCLLPLLAQFPLRGRPNLRSSLAEMLHTALALTARDELHVLIQMRLDAPKVDGPQRACWLAAGLLLDSNHYLPIARCYLHRRPPAARDLAAVLHEWSELGRNFVSLASNILGFLIERFAVDCSPADLARAGWVSPNMNRADLVKGFLNELAGRPDAESAQQLAHLNSLPTLSEWTSKLREARAAQQIVWRDATYERPMWPQVCGVLQQGAPSSAAEIAAVVNDTIEELKEQVGRSDLNLNHQYWNANPHKQATTPRHEELCRNTFADQLRIRLERFDIACLPETHHADGKRSDVWCTLGTRGGVPIEVKRDGHPELWVATRGQLIARYAIDPRAKGHGIYLVLWFANPKQIPLPPSGVRPQTPEEMQLMLEANLSEEEKRVVTVHVLDCSIRSGK